MNNAYIELLARAQVAYHYPLPIPKLQIESFFQKDCKAELELDFYYAYVQYLELLITQSYKKCPSTMNNNQTITAGGT